MPRQKEFDIDETLEKAMTLFWKKGFKGTSISALVKDLGINRASLYDTFGGKEQLYKAAVSKYLENNKYNTQNFLFKHEDVKDGFTQLFYQSIENCIATNDNRGCMFVNSVTELLPNNPEFYPILAANKKQMEEIFSSCIQNGQEKGIINKSKDPDTLSNFFFTIYAGLNVSTKIEADKEKLYILVDTALDIM